MKNLLSFGFILSLLTGLLVSDLAAQDRPASFCGTEMGRSAWLQNFQRNPGAVPRTADTVYVPVQVHITAKSNGADPVNMSKVIAAFCLLNEDFASAKIQFFIEGLDILPNNTIYDHNNSIATLLRLNNVDGRVNAYFVENANGNCGYYTPAGNAVVMDIDCTSGEDHTWSHEMGHFLSLPHTFYGWEGVAEPDYGQPAPETVFFRNENVPVEKADSSNCAIAADGFCDTAADYLNERWPCQSDSTSQQLQLDPDSVAFRSQGSYIMGYALDPCVSIFTPEQEAAMKANIEGPRSNLISNPGPEILADADLAQLNLLEPANGSVPPFFDSVRLTWTPIEAALGYVVQLNIINNFSQTPALEFTTFDTTLVIEEGLAMNRRYFWRVSPLMPYKACNNFTAPRNFRTSTTSPVVDPVLSGALKVYPNPVGTGTLVLELNDGSLRGNLEYEFLDRLGRIVRRGTIGNFGTTRIDVSGLPTGIYFLRAQADGRFTTKKIVVN
jgi:hypothetical protein